MHARAASIALAAAGFVAACTSSSPEKSGSTSEAATTVCPKSSVEGIDVSGGQGVIDWAKVKASGREFAFIKATQGDYYTSNHWTDQWSGAKAAGVLRSPYHFFDPTIDGVAQAKYFLGVVGGLGVGDLPPMLDIECPTASTPDASQSNCEHSGDSGWVDAATLNQRVHDWLNYVTQQTGRTPIVYSYNYWFQGAGMDSTTLVGKYPFYVSWPATNGCYQVGLGNSFTSAEFWQWSVTGTCPGVPATGTPATVDLDRFVGTLAELQGLAGIGVDAGAEAGAPDAASDDAASPLPDAGGVGPASDSGPAMPAAAASGDSGGCAMSRARGDRSFASIAIACAAIVIARRRANPARARRSSSPA
jgi:GH25 family lysozyme M1 (1,4-beta-N-acetylmuramidase)